MTRLERARQFMPFVALKGFEGLIRETENTPEEKRELSDSQVKEINDALLLLVLGDDVTVTYYDGEGYRTLRGILTGLSPEKKTLSVFKETVPFSALYKIEKND